MFTKIQTFVFPATHNWPAGKDCLNIAYNLEKRVFANHDNL